MKTDHEIQAVNPAAGGSVPAFQKHYHPRELAELWGVSTDIIRRWFEAEPGVLQISMGYRRGKDHRVSLRIPQSVAERVYERHCA